MFRQIQKITNRRRLFIHSMEKANDINLRKQLAMEDGLVDSYGNYKRAPHCDELVLHTPGECEICDKYASERQQSRIKRGVNFTGHYDKHKTICPSENFRTADTIYKWGGNRPTIFPPQILTTPDLTVNIKLEDKNARVPTKAHGLGDSCWDLYSCEDVQLLPGHTKAVDTGIILEIPQGWGGFIWSRSGLALKFSTMRSGGVIDAAFRDKVKVILINHSTGIVDIKVGDRVGQIDFRRIYNVEFKQVSVLTETNRKGGFGSSGR